jgi:excisionase family DNA binding protein
MTGVGEQTLLRPSEVAAIFGVQPRTVVRWAQEGRLPSIRTPGGHTRFQADAVNALAAERDAQHARPGAGA